MTEQASAPADRGAVTVEAALALCSIMVVLALAIGAVGVAGAQLRCMDAAREAARLVARGEPDRAREVGQSIAPAGALVDISITADEVVVEVSREMAGPLGVRVSARALGVLEPEALPTAGGPSPAPDPNVPR